MKNKQKKVKPLGKSEITQLVNQLKKREIQKAKKLFNKFNENISKENLNALYGFLLKKNQEQKLLQNEIQVLKRKIKD